MEEILFDPQTSGGLLISLAKEDAPALLGKLKASGLPAEIVGEVLEKAEPEILVTNLMTSTYFEFFKTQPTLRIFLTK